MEILRHLLRTEPVRLAALLESIVALVAMFTNLIDPAQAAVIIAALVSVHEVLRSIVTSPDTVETMKVVSALRVAAAKRQGNSGA